MAQDKCLVKLLGEKIEGKDGKKDVTELIGEKNVVGLYFSAHWCPPCRAFTPQLASWYSKFKETENGKNFDIVFVSSDRDDEGFNEYYKSMPWLALPFVERAKKAELSRKYKVSGIPTLVMIDSEGKMITGDGRAIITDDPEGKDFPWQPESFLDVIRKAPLLADAKGKEINYDDLTVSHIGLYFSAHWCGPCCSFTPELVKTYNLINKQEKKFEIIFLSSDRDDEAFTGYFGEMPWLALKFDDDRKKKLSRMYEVSGIPTLVIVDRTTGAIITDNGRGAIQGDPSGDEFPWHPKAVDELKTYTAPLINQQPALIWLTDESEEESKEACAILTPIAAKYLDEVNDMDVEKLAFFYSGPNSTDDDIATSLKGFLRLPDKTPILFAVNIPKQRKHICEEGKITPEVVQQIVDDFKTDSLEWKALAD